MKALHKVTFILLIIGGLNWLAIGLSKHGIGDVIGGSTSVASRIIYILVGLSALYEIFTHKRNCKACDSTSAPATPTM